MKFLLFLVAALALWAYAPSIVSGEWSVRIGTESKAGPATKRASGRVSAVRAPKTAVRTPETKETGKTAEDGAVRSGCEAGVCYHDPPEVRRLAPMALPWK